MFAPVNCVFNTPTLEPCVTLAPLLSVIVCESIDIVHSFCETTAPLLSVIPCAAIIKVHSLNKSLAGTKVPVHSDEDNICKAVVVSNTTLLAV